MSWTARLTDWDVLYRLEQPVRQKGGGEDAWAGSREEAKGEHKRFEKELQHKERDTSRAWKGSDQEAGELGGQACMLHIPNEQYKEEYVPLC